MNLTRRSWPLGWTPSSDNMNGDPSGLLRMDNLQQDEQNVLSLCRGIQKIYSNFSNYVDQIYSKIISNNEVIWVSLGATGSSVKRSANGTFSDAIEICQGSNRGIFGDCLGQILICAGNQRKKDNGTVVKDLGLSTPNQPVIADINQAQLGLAGSWFINEGAGNIVLGNTGDAATVDENTFRGVIGCDFSGALDTLSIVDGPASNPDDDLIQFTFANDDTSQVTDVTMYFVLDYSFADSVANFVNYYSFAWQQSDLTQGKDAATSLNAKRGDFTRFGTDTNVGWNNVKAIVFSVNCTSSINFVVKDAYIAGGLSGGLNGVYTWVQVNITDNGYYLAKSPTSIATPTTPIINGYVTLQPAPTSSEVTDVWFFRRTEAQVGIGSTSSLDQYYLTAQTKPGVNVDDKTPDVDALVTNIKLNPYLLTLKASDTNGMIDDIFCIEGLYNERMLYMTFNAIHLSDRLNPDAIDSRYSIKISGDPTEKNLWIKKLTNNVIILGTTKDVYELTGTFLDLPDGTIDVAVIAIGEKYPPLSNDACSVPGGGIAYLAADGLRLTSGSNTVLISPQLRLLFQGLDRHGLAPAVISEYGRYAIGVGKTRLFCTLPETDGLRRLLIYNFIDKTFRIQVTDPVAIHITKTDRVLLGYNESSQAFLAGALFELDRGLGFNNADLSPIQGFPVVFQTIYDANEQPRNRKDTFTLKIVCDTGGRTISVQGAKDGGSFQFLQNITSNGPSTSYIKLDSLTLGFRYAIRIVDTNLLYTFKLYEMTVEYEPRPEQLNYLRIQANNLNTISRKRFGSYAFVLDTLGNNVVFTPYVDNSTSGLTPSNSTINTTAKQTYIHYFTSDTVGTDIGGILDGGPFEFYGLNLEEIKSEKLPVPTKYLKIPENNFGSPNRKRHSSYKFQINTRGKNVKYTPILDGVQYDPLIFNSNRKKTIEYFFDPSLGDIIGIDIGGVLESLEDTPFEFYDVIVPQQIEVLPPRLEYFRIPNSNLGTVSRKRFVNFAFVVDTGGAPVTFQPIIDGGIYGAPTTIQVYGKTTYIHYFHEDVVGTDIGGYLTTQFGQFEFYGVDLEKIVSEILPTPIEYLVIPQDDYGKPNRKRHTSYKFQINTRGHDVQFTPRLDGELYEPRTFNTSRKTTVEYFFDLNRGDTISIDIGGILESLDTTPFEFYGVIVPQEIEVLPARLEFFKIPNTNLGSDSRKRLIAFAFVIDTYGQDVEFYPLIDNTNNGTNPSVGIFNTSGKQTVIHYFLQETIGTDIGGYLKGNSPFEFYNVEFTQTISEMIPAPARYLVIPANDYGTPNRKRHTSYKFQINTRGQDVKFTPILDGQIYEFATYNTSKKTTVEYFFNLERGDVIGIDLGGTLESLTPTPFEFYGTIVPETVEKLPDRLTYFRIPNTNLGTDSRKRFINYAIVIDTYGQDATLTMLIDNANGTLTPATSTINTSGKLTHIHYFIGDTTGTDIGAFIQCSTPFEFYGLNLEKISSEVLPTPTKFLYIPANDYGKPNRKRHSSYKFQINTRGGDVEFVPILDGQLFEARTYNTTRKQTVEYFFNLERGDVIGIDIGGTLRSLSNTPFEFYDVVIPQEVEVLPARLEYYRIPNSNLGSVSRKRFINYALVIDTYGHDAKLTILIDNESSGIVPGTSTINTTGKETYIHYFTQEQLGTDIGAFLEGDFPFECYGINPEKISSEILPVPTKYLIIPANNYGTPNRKRHSSYKFQINTRGKNVRFTPFIDTIQHASTSYNTPKKATVEYFFPTSDDDVIGIDVYGILESLEDTPFEFYDVIIPQKVETLPERLEFYRIPNSNLGAAARKRVRTIPMVIDTYGFDVTFTPIVDGVEYQQTSTFNTIGRTTVYHYFINDTFGTDYGGKLVSQTNHPFEFYNLENPENVETLPVPKRFDQIGPVRFDRIGKLFNIRTRLIVNGTTTMMPFTIYGDDSISNPSYNNILYQSYFPVTPGIDTIYEVQIPKNVNSSIIRITLGPINDTFHRYDMTLKVSQSGMETNSKWIPVK